MRSKICFISKTPKLLSSVNNIPVAFTPPRPGCREEKVRRADRRDTEDAPGNFILPFKPTILSLSNKASSNYKK